MKMASPSWLLVALIAQMCHSSRGSKCWDSPVCTNLSNKQRMLECIRMCMSVMQNESPQVTDNNDADDLLGLAQSGLTPAVRSRSAERRSYSMEHFRWGKPSGRKRKPVKVFSSSEGEGSTEGTVPLPSRRRLAVKRSGDAPLGSRSKSYASYSKQERKDGTYRMSHFRWGSPPATKRNSNLLKQRQDERPQSPLSKLFRNLMGKDMEMMAG